MLKKLSSFATLLALVAGTLINSGTAHAACTFGPVSPSTNNNNLISSAVFGNSWVLYGQNQGQWSNGGFDFSFAQRFDNGRSLGVGRLFGAAYTTELMNDGSFSRQTTGFNDLVNRAIITVPPKAGRKIAALQVQIWFCQ